MGRRNCIEFPVAPPLTRQRRPCPPGFQGEEKGDESAASGLGTIPAIVAA
jgi:hypothetical protein